MLALCCIVLICVEITTGFKLLDIRSSSGKRQLDIVIVPGCSKRATSLAKPCMYLPQVADEREIVAIFNISLSKIFFVIE